MPISRRDAIKLALAGSALATSNRAFSNDEVKTLDIVFEGGGIKGAAFCGALEVLELRGFSYRHLIGTSAGAITAALLAAGYRSGQMQAILTERDGNGRHVFNSFLLPPSSDAPRDTPSLKNGSFFDRSKARASELLRAASDRLPGSARNVASELTQKAKGATGETKTQWGRMLALLSTGAFASDAAFLSWLCDRLKDSPVLNANGNTADDARALTLRQFQEFTRGNGVQLSVVATDVTGMRSLVLNHHTAPEVPLVDAVRMSMGIPIVWPEVEWKKSWGKYRGRIEMWDQEDAGNRVVDGGVLSNFPLKYLIDARHVTEEGVLGRSLRSQPTKILGLLLDETLPIPGVDLVAEKKHLAEKLPAYRSLSRVLNAMSGASDQEAIEDARKPEVAILGLGADSPLCRIPVKGYQTLDFDMDQKRMETLIKSGRTTMEAYLARP
jgi:NTE family protein